MEPPNREAMKVARCEKSNAREKEMGPRGIDGTIGESWIEMNERTFPRAAIRATKLRPFEVEMLNITLVKRRIYHY